MHELRQKGFTISEYQHKFLNGFQDADYHVDARSIAIDENIANESVDFIDHVFLRASPNFLRKDYLKNGQGLFSLVMENLQMADQGKYRYPDQAKKLLHGLYSRGPISVSIIKKLMKDERTRPKTNQYVFAHVLLPHSPYNIDRDLEVRGFNTSWKEQALASVNLMSQFIQQLKDEGKYENATIIFQGDHGEEFLEGQDKGELPQQFYKRVKTLLLIKPPFAKGKLVNSRYPAQLLDVAPTLYSIVGISPLKGFEGVDLFKQDNPQKREINILTFKTPIKNNKPESIHQVTHDKDNKWVVKERYHYFK